MRAPRPTASASSASPARERSSRSPPSTATTLWTSRVGSLGYTTPAIADGRVFVGGFDGALRAYSAKTGQELWRRTVPGRILGAPVVVGKLVFFSTLEQRTYAADHVDGKGRLADRYGQVLARDRHRPPLLLLAERDPDGVSRAEQPARGQMSGGCRRRQAGERRIAEPVAFHAATFAR